MGIYGWYILDVGCALPLEGESAKLEIRQRLLYTLQDLHFQTKFASPLLPDISLLSCLCVRYYHQRKEASTDESTYADPIGVGLST